MAVFLYAPGMGVYTHYYAAVFFRGNFPKLIIRVAKAKETPFFMDISPSRLYSSGTPKLFEA